jgi:uncharacterized repeat protein (TIGR03803 family)
MKRNVLFAVLFGLPIGSAAHAANPQTVPVYTFTCKGTTLAGGYCPDGGRPDWIIQGSDGNFYGAAWDSQEGSSQPTGGTIFSLTPSGTFTLLHSFPAGANNSYPAGNNPADLVEGPDGNLYGSTASGGSPNGGILFRIGKDGLRRGQAAGNSQKSYAQPWEAVTIHRFPCATETPERENAT